MRFGGCEAGGQFERSLVEVGSAFVVGAGSFELVESGRSALDDPAHLAQSGPVGDAASCDQWFDATLSQQVAVLVEVVAAVGVPGFAVRTSTQTPDRRDGVEQWQELGDVTAVAAGRGHS